MQLRQIVQVIFVFASVGTTMAIPYLKRADYQCAIATSVLVSVKKTTSGPRMIASQSPTASLDAAVWTSLQISEHSMGCLAAGILIQKPCENACFWRQLTNAYCADDPDGNFC